MSLHKLALTIRQTNHENGFNAPTWENLPTKVMMAVTELNEGMDAIEGIGDDPLAEELADTAVRILDILHSIWGDDWADRTQGLQLNVSPGLFERGEVMLWRPLRMLCTGVESWRYDREGDVRSALELALKEVFVLGLQIGVDVQAEAEQKNAKNKYRGRLHGKNRSDG